MERKREREKKKKHREIEAPINTRKYQEGRQRVEKLIKSQSYRDNGEQRNNRQAMINDSLVHTAV